MGKVFYLNMSEQARVYLGAQGNPNDRAFVDLKLSSYMNAQLSKWIMKAAITKDITFHCARHTFALLN